MNELIRTWENTPFKLELFDTQQILNQPQHQLAYKFYCKGSLIFEGNDYGCSPMHSIDGDESVAGLLGFLALREGDTEDDYFKDYTQLQLDFADEFGEDLSYLAMDLGGE